MTTTNSLADRHRIVTRRLRLLALVAGTAVVVTTVTGWPTQIGWSQTSHSHSRLHSVNVEWPDGGQSAIAVAGLGAAASPGPVDPVPIASVAKIMTAYVVLRDHPLTAEDSGFTLTFDAADVAQEQVDRAGGQSTVAVAAGEQLTEREALEALLLPSANNVAMALAVRVGGNTTHFLAEMNAEAKRLGMHHTRYTDPSGLDASTVSTARDQLRLARAAMSDPMFAHIVGLRQTWIPVAGTIHNTNTLLGTDGFVGIKTGSDDAAGGCFVFEAVQQLNGQQHVVFGVVLGQVGGPLIPAALSAGQHLVDGVMDQLASS